MQDKDGHHDYWSPDFTLCGWMENNCITNFFDGDDVKRTYELRGVGEISGVKYYHFDDVFRSRDETYNILGRFLKKYPVLRGDT